MENGALVDGGIRIAAHRLRELFACRLAFAVRGAGGRENSPERTIHPQSEGDHRPHHTICRACHGVQPVGRARSYGISHRARNDLAERDDHQRDQNGRHDRFARLLRDPDECSGARSGGDEVCEQSRAGERPVRDVAHAAGRPFGAVRLRRCGGQQSAVRGSRERATHQCDERDHAIHHAHPLVLLRVAPLPANDARSRRS